MKKGKYKEESFGTKKILFSFSSLLICGLVLFSGAVLLDSKTAQADSKKFDSEKIIVKFKSNLSQEDEKMFLEKNDFVSMKKIIGNNSKNELINEKIKARGIDRIFSVEIKKGVDIEKTVEKLKNDSYIEYAEPNYILSNFETIPNDEYFSELWGMNNTGQTGGIVDADIDAVEAWDATTGSNDVVVAIIDTGIDYNNPDLAQNIWINPNEIAGDNIDNDGNGFIDDVHGWDFYNNDNDPMDDDSHGTHCAGIIGAVGNDEAGVVGVNWNVKMMPVKFLSAEGYGSSEGAIQSIIYAATMGVDIMSNSWGGGYYSSAEEDVISFVNDLGILFVASAGNYGTDNDMIGNYPSNYNVPNIIAVAATDNNDQKASFSNYGLTTVDLGAPGVSIYSTILNNEYAYYDGTSMAAPHVSGVAGLIKARFPNADSLEMKTRILNGVDVVSSLVGKTVTGGRLNAFAALDDDDISPAKIEDLAVMANDFLSITLSWTAPGDDGNTGTAKVYDLRYSALPITEENWDAAIQISNEPVPSETGTVETVTINGLEYNRFYYFAIKSYDNVGNLSDLSNVLYGSVKLDYEAPAQVQDLSMVSNEYDSITLSWTAPGDDGNLGTAVSYDLRYSTSTITQENWDIAIQTVKEPVPGESGTTESFKVSDLELNTIYYFAIKTTDKVDNVSALSNVFGTSTKESVIVFGDDMENGLNGWVATGTDGVCNDALWHQSQRRSNSPVTSWYYGMDDLGYYDVGAACTGYLISPDIDLTDMQNPVLDFQSYQYVNIIDVYYGEVLRIDISTDGGSTWGSLLTPTRTMNSTSWNRVKIDLANYSGSVVKFRFYFYSNAGVATSYEGWYIDDFRVYGENSYGNISPVAEAGVYQVGIVRLNMEFNGSASYDLDGSIVSYNWDFGDGTYGTGEITYHTYADAGTYYAKLTTIDNNGATAFDSVARVIEYKEDVEISKTQYSKAKKILSVIADSSVYHGYVTLTLVGFGEMTYNSETGQYYIDVYSEVNPESVTVISSLGGWDTEAVASNRYPR